MPAELELDGANESVWYGGGRWAVDGNGDAEGDADVWSGRWFQSQSHHMRTS